MTDAKIEMKQSPACEHVAVDERKVTVQEQHPPAPVVIDAQGVWHISGFDEARQILRAEFTKQAGFHAEDVKMGTGSLMKNPPILFLEGEEHHRMRRETNKFFTPSISEKQYQSFMETFADTLIERFKNERYMDLRELTMEMAMRVAAQVVGLTSSIMPGLQRRLEGLLKTGDLADNLKKNLVSKLLSQRHVFTFFLLDVKPAIRARRKTPQNDVISYLLTRNYNDLEILTECVVYGVAGMATTREFIAVALWHLLEKPHLRQRMLVGEQAERYAILHEILRLEPIIGHLFRRTTHEITLESQGQTHTIPAGTLLDINIFVTNADPRMAGEDALSVCPSRPLTSTQGKVPEPVMSFGDGYHRCPGAYIAIQESDIFLRKLLALESLRIEKTPDVTYNKTVSGYEMKNFMIRVD